MADYLVREATDEDGPALARLLQAAVSEKGAEGPEAADESLAAPASYFSERGGRLWVVMQDGELAGSLGLTSQRRPREFELSMLCLDRDLRGEGFAAALLAGANAFAAASGGERLTLWVDTRFEDVHRFCERQGFVRQPGTRARPDGSEALEAHFERQVS